MSHRAETPHLGSSLSCVDILVAAYFGTLRIDPKNPWAPDRDRFILSKGHAAMALYATLACRGLLSEADLATYNEDGSLLAEHPSLNGTPGIEASTGSLGHGLGVTLGFALGNRIQKIATRCFAVLSDGECEEGSTWEAALFAPIHQLTNVAIVVDYNRWQATGRSNEIMSLQPLADKWRAFGWSAYEVDGHDLSALVPLLRNVPDGSGKPIAILAHTTKGKGVSFMEDDNNWHYRIPTAAEVEAAHKELGLK
jgi:transketolase